MMAWELLDVFAFLSLEFFWFSALFQNERPKELPELRFREVESIASSFETEINDY